MGMRLLLRSLAGSSQESFESRGAIVIVGSGAHCDLRLPAPVAETHAIMTPVGRRWMIDARAENATAGGIPLTIGVERLLPQDTTLVFATVPVEMRVADPVLALHGCVDLTLHEALLVREEFAPDRFVPSIVFAEGDRRGNTYRLEPRERPHRIGCDPLFEVRLRGAPSGARVDVAVDRGSVLVRADRPDVATLGGVTLSASYAVWDPTAMLRVREQVYALEHPLLRARAELLRARGTLLRALTRASYRDGHALGELAADPFAASGSIYYREARHERG
jgi:hypothetical protein